jgi:hypothetical protein
LQPLPNVSGEALADPLRCASTLLAEGAPITAVAGHLGDTVETVSRVYAHWLRDDRDVPADVLDRVLAPADALRAVIRPRKGGRSVLRRWSDGVGDGEPACKPDCVRRWRHLRRPVPVADDQGASVMTRHARSRPFRTGRAIGALRAGVARAGASRDHHQACGEADDERSTDLHHLGGRPSQSHVTHGPPLPRSERDRSGRGRGDCSGYRGLRLVGRGPGCGPLRRRTAFDFERVAADLAAVAGRPRTAFKAARKAGRRCRRLLIRAPDSDAVAPCRGDLGALHDDSHAAGLEELGVGTVQRQHRREREHTDPFHLDAATGDGR